MSALRPSASDIYDLGATGARWKDLYANNLYLGPTGTIQGVLQVENAGDFIGATGPTGPMGEASQTGAGLNADGSYTAPVGSNYLGEATSLKNADTLLDAQIAIRANEISALDGRLDTAESDIDTLQADVAAKAATATVNAIDARLVTAEGEIDTLQTDVANLNTEINSIETSVGLNANGTKINYSSTAFIENADSHHVAIGKLDQQLSATQSDLDTAEAAIETKASTATVNAINTRLITAEDDIVQLEADVAEKAATATVNAIDARLITAEGEIDTLQVDVTALQTSVASKASQASVDQIEASVGLNANGTYSAHTTSNYINGATTTKGALGLLDAQIKVNANDIVNLEAQIDDIIANGADNAAVTALQNELNTTQLGAGLSITGAYVAHGDANYISGALSLNNADGLLDTAINNVADDLSDLDGRVDTAESDIDGLQDDVTALQADVGAKASTATVNAIDARLVTAEADIDQLQTDVTSLQASVAAKASTATVNAIDARLVTAEGEIDALQNADTELDGRLDTAEADIDQLQSDVNAIDGRLDAVETAYATSASVTAVQNELNTTQTSVGLNADGAKGNYSSSTYIANADSHHTAIGKLDAQLNTTQTALDTAEADIDTLEASVAAKASIATVNAIDDRLVTAEGEIDQLQTDVALIDGRLNAAEGLFATHEDAIGLNANGTYTAPAGGNFVAGASLKASLTTLDTQVKTNTDNIAAKASTTSVTNLQTEVNAIETGAGLNADGTWTAPASNYISASTSIKTALTDLDTEIKSLEDDLTAETAARTAADTALQSELDASQVGVGLNANGTYTTPAANNYLGNASLKLDLAALDAQLFATQSDLDDAESDIVSIQGELNTTQTSVGLNANGTKPNYSSTEYIANADSHHVAIGKIDAALAALDTSGVGGIQTEIDAIETAVGLNADGSYSAHVSSNYINDATSVKDALGLLDSEIEDLDDRVDDAEIDIEDLQDEVEDLELRDGGILLEDSARNEVQFDATLSQWQGFSGPLQVNLLQLVTDGQADVRLGWCTAPRLSDRHLLVKTNGDVDFTGFED